MLASFSFQFLYHFHLIIFNNVFLSLAALGTILNCTLSWQDEEVVLLFCLKKSCLSHAGWTVHSLNWHIWLFYILMRIFVPVIFTYWWAYLYLSRHLLEIDLLMPLVSWNRAHVSVWTEVFLFHSVWAKVFLVHLVWAEVFLVHCGQKSF